MTDFAKKGPQGSWISGYAALVGARRTILGSLPSDKPFPASVFWNHQLGEFEIIYGLQSLRGKTLSCKELA